VARFSEPRAFKGQLLPSVELANPSKNIFFGHTLHQCLRVRRHLRCFPLITDQWQKQLLVGPLGGDGQVHMVLPLGRAFPAGLEGSLWVLVPMIAPQCQPQL
jgi:hypothetical protein